MREQLKGTTAERLRDLRRERNLSQEKLAGIIGVDKSTISRIENGDTFKSDVALSLADYFGVSMDYLFGLSYDKSQANYDLKKLGISSAAAEKLCSEEVDADIVNMLIEHPDFGDLAVTLALYFTDVEASDARNHNTLCDELSRIVGYMRSEGSADASRKIQTINILIPILICL